MISIKNFFTRHKRETEYYQKKLEKLKNAYLKEKEKANTNDLAVKTIDSIQNLIDNSFIITEISKGDIVNEIVCYREIEDGFSDGIQVEFVIKLVYQEKMVSTREYLFAIRKEHKIFIDDIQVTIGSQYGTILLENLIKYAKTHNIPKITGNLMPTDVKDHKEHLYHFYKKFGFKIIDTDDEFTKRIKLEL